jgi:GT2 family glycosyltransferase
MIANCCSDDTIDIARQSAIPIEVVSTTRRLGFASCNNIGLRRGIEQAYDYVFLLNPDTFIHPLAIERLVRFLDCNRLYDIAGCLQTAYGRDDWENLNNWSRIAIAEAKGFGQTERMIGESTILDHDYVQGAAMMIRISIVRRIGMLDPLYGTFYEETDFCRRCQFAGRRVCLVMESKIQHFEGGNWRSERSSNIERDFLYLRNQFLFFLSRPQSKRLLPIAALRLIGSHIRILYNKLDSTCMPLWQYPRVVASALSRATQIFKLMRRNRLIIEGVDELPPDLVAIGHE